MSFLRNAGSRISLYLAGICFFLAVNTFVFFGIVNAGNIKQTLRDEDTYSKLVPAMLATAQYDGDQNTIGQLPLQEPWVQEAAQKAFPAPDLEQKGNTAIDGTFNYLEGKTSEPEFQLDFTANKQNLAAELGQSAENRLAGLPRCMTIPESVDVFTIDCLPLGVNPSQIGDQLMQRYASDQRFLPNPVITADTLSLNTITGDQSANTTTPTASLSGLRDVYQVREVMQWFLPALMVIFGVLGIYLTHDRRKGMRILARSFLVGAVGLALFAVIVNFVLHRGIEAVQTEAVTRDIVGPVLLSFVDQARTIYLVFAGIGVGIAVVLFIISRKLRSPVHPVSKPINVVN